MLDSRYTQLTHFIRDIYTYIFYVKFALFQIVTHQQRIFMILNSLKISVTVIDIASPGMEDDTDFMRGNAKKKDGQRHVLPPQIFNGEKYCGVMQQFIAISYPYYIITNGIILELVRTINYLSIIMKDYDDFDLANEDDVLEEFLGIPRKNAKAAPVALDVLPDGTDKPEVGKLPTSVDSAGTSEEVPMETDKIA